MNGEDPIATAIGAIVKHFTYFILIDGSPNRIHVRLMSGSVTDDLALLVISPRVNAACAGLPFVGWFVWNSNE